eukprot:1952940-Rhodomonas_salina.2
MMHTQPAWSGAKQLCMRRATGAFLCGLEKHKLATVRNAFGLSVTCPCSSWKSTVPGMLLRSCVVSEAGMS